MVESQTAIHLSLPFQHSKSQLSSNKNQSVAPAAVARVISLQNAVLSWTAPLHFNQKMIVQQILKHEATVALLNDTEARDTFAQIKAKCVNWLA